MTKNVLENAQLSWRDEKTPVSSQFDDVYFSIENGLAESNFVFLEHNNLTERFSSLETSHFTIAETGFGTGLNFLLTWKLWQESKKNDQHLYYISVEKFPLSKQDLEKSLECWPDLSKESRALLNHYPPLIPGLHCIEINKSVTLILIFDDAVSGFKKIQENNHPAFKTVQGRSIDAWFLDGFAPSKNPEMWTDELFHLMAQMSGRQSTLASFTAAGYVRRGLMAAGFSIKRVKGFGKKREMIQGYYQGLPTIVEHLKTSVHALPYDAYWPIHQNPDRNISNILIIGAGIAGCTTAYLLAEAGIQVRLIDSKKTPMQGASGNAQVVLFPKLSHKSSLFSDFNLSSYLYALNFYQQGNISEAFSQCGMLQLLNSDEYENAIKLQTLFTENENVVQLIDAEKASEIADTHLKHRSLWFPNSGWINTVVIADKILRHPNIEFIGNTTISSLTKVDTIWQLSADNKTPFQSNNIILCNANAANQLLPNLDLPLSTIRGQTSHISCSKPTPLNTIVCHDGYICPSIASNDNFTCGASYDLKDENTEINQNSHQQNLDKLNQYLPSFSGITETVGGRVEFRCTAPDYMPIIGPVPIKTHFTKNYQTYSKNSKAHIPITGKYEDGLFLNIAYGSRGFSSAPIGAAMIKSYLMNQPYPLPFELMKAMNPARFIIKDIIRRKHD